MKIELLLLGVACSVTVLAEGGGCAAEMRLIPGVPLLFVDEQYRDYKVVRIAPSLLPNEDLLKNLCDIQVENKLSLIPLPLTDMLILKSITTVQPYDLPLARLYLKQYTEAKEALTEADRNLLRDIKEQGLPTLDDSYSEQVYRFLKVERKLFTQYAH